MSQARGQKGGQPDNAAGQTKANMEKDKLRQGKPHGKSSSKSHLGDAVLDFLFASGRTLRRDNGKMVVVKHREKPKSTPKVSLTEQWVNAQSQPQAPPAPVAYEYYPYTHHQPPMQPPIHTPLQPVFQPVPQATVATQAAPAVQAHETVANQPSEPRTHGASEWTAEQDATILRMKDNENSGFAKIGHAIGKAKKEVSQRYYALKKANSEPQASADSSLQKPAEKGPENRKKGNDKSTLKSKEAEVRKGKQATKDDDSSKIAEKGKGSEHHRNLSGDLTTALRNITLQLPEFFQPTSLKDSEIQASAFVEEDTDFSLEELAILAKVVHSYQTDVWLELSSRFWDRYDWRPDPDQIRRQWMRDANSDTAGTGPDDAKELSEADMEIMHSLMVEYAAKIWPYITNHFNCEAGRRLHPRVIKAKLTGNDESDYDDNSDMEGSYIVPYDTDIR